MPSLISLPSPRLSWALLIIRSLRSMSMMQLGKIRPAVLKLLVITTETPSRTAALFLFMILKARSKSVEFSDLLFAPQEPESSFFRRLSSETGIRASVGEKWLETHVRSHIAFACARVLRAEIRFVVRAHSRTQIPKSARAFASANF